MPLFSTRRIFCCGVGWPTSGSPPKQAAASASSDGLPCVNSTFQVRSRSRISAWPGLSIEASVNKAEPAWSGGWLALLEVPLPPWEVGGFGWF